MKKRGIEKKKISRASKSGILVSCSIGLCGAAIILLVLLILFSAIGLSNENPHSMLTPLSFFAIYTSAFFGGFIAIKKNKSRDALLCGLICGMFITITFCMIFLLIGIILNVESTALSWLFRAITIIFSTLGSFLGIKRSNGIPKKRHRRRK